MISYETFEEVCLRIGEKDQIIVTQSGELLKVWVVHYFDLEHYHEGLPFIVFNSYPKDLVEGLGKLFGCFDFKSPKDFEKDGFRARVLFNPELSRPYIFYFEGWPKIMARLSRLELCEFRQVLKKLKAERTGIDHQSRPRTNFWAKAERSPVG